MATLDRQHLQAPPLSAAKQELSTDEEDYRLKVSRPFLIQEMEAGRLPHRQVGSHRRVLFEDLMVYERAVRAQQQHALERMADNARDLGLDY